ncbi:MULTISPECIES: hypothetical protein [Pseudoalteromonas]|uniref:Thymidylate kinase n=1 Tax=Pseudoalteromonas luteoviolacea (strain 2ta16) TaxID=1353533 RepID=V4HNY8_PSEL2|nr:MULTISPECIES: hypothetical protein [Pseudoalteromonas]ESP91483.1 hypothetical protein PL2TA16_00282 [Pseudoalteromonas luteoviolacea 2ta16]KZN40132.1 hypothetical protein N483_18255 [Pseudoalteromonas luteoviolacea NCIMB 1944]MCG7551179.1 hypothetical protein [Pseudoalteromonas sp. Of7M-16]
MIVTFEGAPAVGKSTIASALKDKHGCYVIPEVNKLFGKDNRESDLWYYQKQIERCHIASSSASDAMISILDGDVFQPVWFGITFPDENWGCFDTIVSFYRKMIDEKQVSFPNKYVYFHVPEALRANRERGRSSLLGRSSEEIEKKIMRFQRFSALHKDYFSDLKAEFPELVCFHESNDISRSIESVLSCVDTHQYKDSDIFDFMIERCRVRTRTIENR